MLRNLQGWPLVIIILAIIILVGWKRLPDAARSVGRSMRIFKSEVEQMSNKPDEDKPSAASKDTVDGVPRPEPIDRDHDHSSHDHSSHDHRDHDHSSDVERSGTDERNS